MTLLSNMASNPKTKKELKERGFEGTILHLASADKVSEFIGRKVTVCPAAKANGCDKPCLDEQGRGRMKTVKDARIKKTVKFFEDRKGFGQELREELNKLIKRAEKKGFKPVARLDGTSDLGLAMKMHGEFPEIQFYDYTKVFPRMKRWLRDRPKNHHITFSLGNGNRAEAIEILGLGGNVAVVFRTRDQTKLPEKWEGFTVINGDQHDYRFLDPEGSEGYVVGLTAKGTAYHDTSGFVQEI
tara:strand:+ start:2284 stop:3009 length:726 start_codon:yes stop_codon:yes gene_type:complete